MSHSAENDAPPTAEVGDARDSLARWLYARSGGIFWNGETTWQERHRAEADQWFAYSTLLDRHQAVVLVCENELSRRPVEDALTDGDSGPFVAEAVLIAMGKGSVIPPGVDDQ